MVHRREIDGQPVVFGNQGDLWQNAMTWFDHDTGSVWSQPTGEAIMGPLKGERLELLPSTLSTWRSWQERFPETLALASETTSRNPFSIEQMVVVASANGASAAVPFVDLRSAGAVSTEIGGEPVLIVADPSGDRWAVFSRMVGGAEAVLERRDDVVFDPASGQTWNPLTGAPIDGDVALDRIPSFSSFGDDYEVFFPEGAILDLR